MKQWAINVEHALEDTSYRMLAVVHDELQGEARPDDVVIVREALARTATEAGEQLGFRIRIDADCKDGSSWGETH